VGPALAAALVFSSLFSQQVAPRQLHVGRSAEGRAIDGYSVGDGPLAVVIVGGIHGRPEVNTSDLVWHLLDIFAGSSVPPHLTVVFVPEANPDGIADDTRELADGVDPNRNFPTSDWKAGTYGPGRWLPDGGGGWPLSEPETIALAQLIERIHPGVVVSYHSAGGIAMGGPASERSGLLDTYAEYSGYPPSNFVAYPVTGDFAQWCDEIGIPTVEVELSDHSDPEIDRNLSGLEAVLWQISERAQPSNPSY